MTVRTRPLSHRERRDLALFFLGVGVYGSDRWVRAAQLAVGEQKARRLSEHVQQLRERLDGT